MTYTCFMSSFGMKLRLLTAFPHGPRQLRVFVLPYKKLLLVQHSTQLTCPYYISSTEQIFSICSRNSRYLSLSSLGGTSQRASILRWNTFSALIGVAIFRVSDWLEIFREELLRHSEYPQNKDNIDGDGTLSRPN